MNKIEEQSGYDFWYNKGTLNESEKINTDFKGQQLNEVLKDLFLPRKVSFEMVDKTIFLKPSIGKDQVNPNKSKIDLDGVVIDRDGKPIPNATIKIKNTDLTTVADDFGRFKITSLKNEGILIVTSLGFSQAEAPFSSDRRSLKIVLEPGQNILEDVQIVSTGYQKLPKERATGSFVLIDSNTINRRVGNNILDRLDGVASGVIFNKNQGGGITSNISVRGRSTLFANPSPLIVLDNFPYEGSLDNINPNDIESISILKDAAAASIWGVKAGNGVIVLTSKKGKAREKIRVSANINATITARPDLHYRAQMSSSEYIDLEKYLFDRGFYNSTINNGYRTISPVVDILLKNRSGVITAAQQDESLNSLRSLDVRDDLEKYLYRPSFNQQYSISVDGGGKNNTFYISGGYDVVKPNLIVNQYERFNLNIRNNYVLFDEKLQISAAILLTTSKSKGNGNSYSSPFTPYLQLADPFGNALSVVTEGGLRKHYTDTAGKGALLDWNYRPLDENYSNNETKLTDYKLNGDAKYKLIEGLYIGMNFQYQKGTSNFNQLSPEDSFFTRNLINSYTKLNQATRVATRPIPLGAINTDRNTEYISNYGRLQADFNRSFNLHSISALAGFEIKDYKSSLLSWQQYGYNQSNASFVPVDFVTNFTQYFSTATAKIPLGSSIDYTIDRFRSSFVNFSYAYDNRYIVSGSARKDESNIFGVSANQKGVPLWSAGIAWNLSNEAFYSFPLLKSVKVRATFGYNGNVDRSTSAYLTARSSVVNNWNIPSLEVSNPPNPSLGWEKVQNANFGIDFTTKGNLFSGSIEYFQKRGQNLIANSPSAPQTGIVQFKGNAADTKTSGWDIVISKNYGNNNFRWLSSLLFSYNKEIITNYKVKQSSNLNIAQSNFSNPLEGYPYAAIFSFAYLGLDGQGKPLGIMNGLQTQNYSGIINSGNPAELIYSGSAIPTFYGYLRNDFSFKNLELSFNIGYKLNYVFRRSGLFGGSSYAYTNVDFEKRWQKPGDELNTSIPALSYPANAAQNSFVQYSEISVEKADHIRLQDIRLSFQPNNHSAKQIFKDLKFYAYAQNLGIIWKATKQNIDPDIGSGLYRNPFSFSIGISTNL
ncbi:SusC/RagA family TonB-linked outer membrane protein [Pedobacter sp. G11]|uniref:SusC/RagA family TonB-linked outer membrane protein n=1 Tax=Pedobacter sp. G11 TaxID=2482728 RepID=UPI00143D5B4F|nr:SusC/RagA family TonB-linked outer membrane protein [Pedobacter sp. G11]